MAKKKKTTRKPSATKSDTKKKRISKAVTNEHGYEEDPDGFFDVETTVGIATTDDCKHVILGIREKKNPVLDDFLATVGLTNNQAAALGVLIIQRCTKNRQGIKSLAAKRRP